MFLSTLHLLLGQLQSDVFHINRMFGHYPISINQALTADSSCKFEYISEAMSGSTLGCPSND